MPARSGSAAWGAVTSAPTRPTCPSCVTTCRRCFANGLAATSLDEWAATDATPTEVEIGRLRALIRRTEEAVDT